MEKKKSRLLFNSTADFYSQVLMHSALTQRKNITKKKRKTESLPLWSKFNYYGTRIHI